VSIKELGGKSSNYLTHANESRNNFQNNFIVCPLKHSVTNRPIHLLIIDNNESQNNFQNKCQNSQKKEMKVKQVSETGSLMYVTLYSSFFNSAIIRKTSLDLFE